MGELCFKSVNNVGGGYNFTFRMKFKIDKKRKVLELANVDLLVMWLLS